MKPELKAKWLEALRSGKYRQGRGALQSYTGTFCCLGVLCDVLDPTGWASNGGPEAPRMYVYRGDERNGYLPMLLGEAIELPSSLQSRLANLNDDGQSFAAIAKVIESEA